MVSQLSMTFGFFAFILISVYWVNRAIRLLDRLIGSGQSMWVFLQFTALTLPNVILLVLPIAAFVASVYVSNRLISDSEMVVMQSAGQSAWHLLRPAAIFGLGVALLMSLLSHFLVPQSRIELQRMGEQVSRNVEARFLTEGEYLHPSYGLTLYIREVTEQGELLDILLSDQRGSGSRTLHLSKKAFIVDNGGGPQLIMLDGVSQTLSKDDRVLSTIRFEDFSYDMSEMIPDRRNSPPGVREMSTGRLLAASEEDRKMTGASRAEFLAEAHTRFAQPLLGLTLTMIGAATLMLGGFSRFGVGKQILAAVVLVILVQMINNMAVNAARDNDRLWSALYTPAIFGIAVSMLVAWRATLPAFRKRGAR